MGVNTKLKEAELVAENTDEEEIKLPEEIESEEDSEETLEPEENSPEEGEKEIGEEKIAERSVLSEPEEKPFDFLFPYIAAVCLIVSLGLGFLMGALFRPAKQAPAPKAKEAAAAVSESGLPDWITEAYLTVDGESRSGEKLEAVRDIAVHYVANAGTSAMANRNYFEGPDSNTSSHFIVGLEGEVLIMIPTDERSCATNSRNPDTISVEVCHPDASGVFSDATYESLIRLLAYLCEEHGLSEENLIRHYDVTGKMCPRYYVEHPEAWAKMKADVKEQLAKGGNRETAS